MVAKNVVKKRQNPTKKWFLKSIEISTHPGSLIIHKWVGGIGRIFGVFREGEDQRRRAEFAVAGESEIPGLQGGCRYYEGTNSGR